MSTFVTVLLSEYHFQAWLQNVFLNPMCHRIAGAIIISSCGHTMQFGTDLLQGAPSDHLSAFIFWHFVVERLPALLFQWTRYSLNFSSVGLMNINIGWNLLMSQTTKHPHII